MMNNSRKYVIVISSFLIQALTFGTAQSIGMYTIELLDHFKVSAAATSLVGSLNIGFLLAAGPLASLLLRKLSYQSVGFLGSFLTIGGLLAVQLIPNIQLLAVIYGVIVGTGFCLTSVMANILTGLYFDKGRSLATGIVSSGIGTGGIVFPLLVEWLIHMYGWRGSMLIIAGVNMNVFPLVLLLRNPPRVKSKAVSETWEDTNYHKSSLLERSSNDKNFAQTDTSLFSCGIFNVFCNVDFLIYLFNNLLWNMGSSVVPIFAPKYFTEIGMSKSEAAFALTVYNLCGIFGGACGGALGNKLNRLVLYSVSTVIKGAITFLMCVPFLMTAAGIYTVMALLGFSFSVFLALLVVITTDILGVKKLGDGVGFVMLFNGLGCIMGPPFGGWLRDISESYIVTFYVSGGLTAFAGIFFLIVPLKKLYTNKMKHNNNDELNTTISI